MRIAVASGGHAPGEGRRGTRTKTWLGRLSAGALLLCGPGLVACDDDGGGAGMMHANGGQVSARHHTMLGGAGGSMMRTGEAAYLSTMVAHHLDAIAAARQLSRSPSPAMRRFGRRIVRDQTEQVHQMRGWLARWYPRTEASSYVPMMSDLSALDGAELDRIFLVEMIRHHMMAVMMSRHLSRADGARHRLVADLAATIERDQAAEITWMRRRLLER
jgi:uncharacterized protein (DUF305 family)